MGRLVRAAAANHTDWFVARAHARGGEVRSENGLTWTISPQEITIAFPHLPDTDAAVLDDIVAECYRRAPASASCWSLSPSRPRDLGARLAARGFEWGWRPHWMALDLGAVPCGPECPAGLRVAEAEDSTWDVEGLPYYSSEDAELYRNLAAGAARGCLHFAAWLDGNVVGHSVLFPGRDDRDVAGIYNVGVVPGMRRKGIGSAVSLAACRAARDLGCRYALLNSAANELYLSLGFVSLGHGQTWWMHRKTIESGPPCVEQVAFAEAVGRGDIAALEDARLPDDLDAPMAGGMTPMALAVAARKPRSADWLAARGATMEVLHAWDLGRRSGAAALLRARPELANRLSGAWCTSPLHEAVLRNDIELARLLVAASPDLAIQDTENHSTPLGWARYFGRSEIVALLEGRP
jgi:GNAT superfamily N-acetyltransferase